MRRSGYNHVRFERCSSLQREGSVSTWPSPLCHSVTDSSPLCSSAAFLPFTRIQLKKDPVPGNTRLPKSFLSASEAFLPRLSASPPLLLSPHSFVPCPSIPCQCVIMALKLISGLSPLSNCVCVCRGSLLCLYSDTGWHRYNVVIFFNEVLERSHSLSITKTQKETDKSCPRAWVSFSLSDS